jgi:hypothetical protein
LKNDKLGKNPPKFATANNFAIGILPSPLQNLLAEVTSPLLSPVRPYACVLSYSGGAHKGGSKVPPPWLGPFLRDYMANMKESMVDSVRDLVKDEIKKGRLKPEENKKDEAEKKENSEEVEEDKKQGS